MEQRTEDFSTRSLGTLIIVVGLPGSEKTTYMASLVEADQGLSVYDDFQGDAYNKDRDPRLSKHFGPLISELKQAKKSRGIRHTLLCATGTKCILGSNTKCGS